MKLHLPLLLLGLATAASAEDPQRDLKDTTNDLTVPSYRGGFYFNGEADLNRGGNFSYHQFITHAPLSRPVTLTDDIYFFTSVDYEVSLMNIDVPVGVPLEDFDLHMLRVPLSILGRSDTSPWTWLVRADPGIATDFNDFDTHDLRIGGRAGVSYAFSDDFSLSAGAGLTEAYGDYLLLPLLGFDWSPAEDWFVSLSGPRFSIAHQPSEDWILRSAVYLSGGAWNVDVAGNSRELTLQSLHAGVGVDHRLTRQIWLSAWTGFSFANKIDLSTTGSGTVYESNADNAWFTFFGMRIAAW